MSKKKDGDDGDRTYYSILADSSKSLLKGPMISISKAPYERLLLSERISIIAKLLQEGCGVIMEKFKDSDMTNSAPKIVGNINKFNELELRYHDIPTAPNYIPQYVLLRFRSFYAFRTLTTLCDRDIHGAPLMGRCSVIMFPNEKYIDNDYDRRLVTEVVSSACDYDAFRYMNTIPPLLFHYIIMLPNSDIDRLISTLSHRTKINVS